ncbi:MAG: TetR/AcrR family transcriptional regulator [Planctomycetota bacterium]
MAGVRPIEFDADAALDAAMNTFWRHGYSGTNLPTLLKETGVARQSLYNTFGDKRQLFLKAVRLYSERQLAAHARKLGGDNPKDALEKFVNGWRHRRRRTAGRGCLVCLTMGEFSDQDPEVSRLVAEHTGKFTALLSERLRSAGAGRRADALASGLVAMSFGIATLCRQPGTQPMIDDATDQALAMVRGAA